ncbi:hypothetical protein [Kamptonema sp. UHCC 0994]|nr:hypothetical protein [Kamptonema sp. UHCC 0994]MDF0555516.1 hypothetical protein [Kamptonema sp. UHCC 0994]
MPAVVTDRGSAGYAYALIVSLETDRGAIALNSTLAVSRELAIACD